MRSFARLLGVPLIVLIASCGGGDHGGHDVNGSNDQGPVDGVMGDGSDVGFDGISDGADGGGMDGFVVPDGSTYIDAGDGSVLIRLPDGAVVYPDGALYDAGGNTEAGDGHTGDGANESGMMDAGDGGDALQIPDGSIIEEDGAVILPDGNLWDGALGCNMANLPDGEFCLPDGGVYTGQCSALPNNGGCIDHEICNNGLDDNCNGKVDDGCTCGTGMTERCYLGCPSQAGVGVCTWGTVTCGGTEFGDWGDSPCNSGHPEPIVCGGFRDWLCDGMIDEGCACNPGDMRPCYDGPPSTRGVGACHDGVQTCAAVDGGTPMWGACVGEQLPTAPQCDGIDHACDGMPYEGCPCMPGATRMCYDGPTNTEGVGVCHGGMQTCIASGGTAMWSPCIGEVVPSMDMCDGIDRECNNMPNPGCVCTPGATRGCYTYPVATENVGLCHDGVETCVATGGVTMWGPCVGDQGPTPELCDGVVHLCNGMPNTGCICVPGTTQSCYDGPPTTEGVGLCHGGTQTCVSGTGGVGSFWGPCNGEVLPASDQCDGIDRACNGMPNPGCTCTPGATRSCYDGPSGTAGVGQCQAGLQTCNATGTGWSGCIGEVLPSPEVCDGIDHLCNGMPNQGCECTPGSTQSCYTGPMGTLGVGTCHAGTENCISGPNNVGSMWGACMGEVTPAPDNCDGTDRMCNGMPYAGCMCIPGATRMCYTGPAGTEGVGLCHGGTESCTDNGSGPMWGPCVGEVTPSPEICDGLDHLCNGMPNTGCACVPGTSRPCYDGPPGTDNVGVCHDGTQMCISGPGGVGSYWGTCTGEVVPGPIVCDGLDHACDGNYPADCPCMPGGTRSCYDGPAGTAGVGTCHAGTQTCLLNTNGSTTWGTCTGEVLPSSPQCDGQDHACTGTLPNCNPMVMCPAPVSTTVGVGVSLSGSATAVSGSSIVGYTWSVIGQPAGSTFTFTPSTTSNPVTFTGNNAGVYTVRLTATDSSGRQSSCSVLVTVQANSYLGTEFYAVTTTNAQLASGTTFHFAVAIGNPNSSAVTATVTGGAITSTTCTNFPGCTYLATCTINGATVSNCIQFTVPANSTTTQTLPWVSSLSHNSLFLQNPPANCCDANCCTTFPCAVLYTPASSSLVTGGGYRVTTSAPVSAYQFNALEYNSTALCTSANGTGTTGTNSYTNDASLLLPTVALTGNYTVLTHNSWSANGSFITIVGTNASSTTVTVNAATAITGGTGVTATTGPGTMMFTLNRGDVVQLIAKYPTGSNPPATFDTEDLTGTTITATHPVGVFAGVDCTYMSYVDNGATAACDHLEQMMFPQETWGHDVVVSQLRDRTATEKYMVRILSRDANNTITLTGVTPTGVSGTGTLPTLQAGQYVEFETNVDFEVQGTGAILVGQFMEGQNTTPGATVGDPAFVLEVPTPQYRFNYNFVVPATYTANYINVVGVQNDGVISLDGTPLSATPVALAGSTNTWSIWRQAVTAGTHVITTTGAHGFGLKVIGVAPFTSYTYPGGLDLRALP